MADGAYDSHKVYEQVLQKQLEANIVIPPLIKFDDRTWNASIR